MKPSDTDDWLEALAGRPRADADPAVNAEAALLREASRRWPVAVPPMSAEEAQVGLAALLAAAQRDARRAERSGCAVCQALRRLLSWPRLAGAAAFASLALLLVVVAPWRSTGVPAENGTLRGPAAEGVQRLRAAEPRLLRERIADELAQAGVAAARYERGGRFGLDAELPVPPPAELVQLLGRHGLVAPPSGGLAVEIEAMR